jgi:hypothetical protein
LHRGADAAQAAALGRLAGVLLALDDPSDGPAGAVATFLAPAARADARALTAAGVPALRASTSTRSFGSSSSTRAP